MVQPDGCNGTRTGKDAWSPPAHHYVGAWRWRFVADNLNTHCSESLVRWVAQRSGLTLDLGEKGKSGVLTNRQTRAAFLSGPTHAVVFHYTPKHTSWMNQIEIWLGILVSKVGAFIEQDNRTMARPFKWTSQGKVLVA